MPINLHGKLTACISSVIHREPGFRDYRFIVKMVLENLGVEAIRNYEDVRTQANFDQVMEYDCDLFILLLGDVVSSQLEKELQIALKRGLPILVFIKANRNKNGNVVCPTAALTFLKKNCPMLYEKGRVYFDTGQELAEHVEFQTKQFIAKKLLLSPIIGVDPPIAYSEGVHLIQEAKYRFILVQRTSCLLLGPRIGSEAEERFYEEMMKWLEEEEDRLFIHFFCWTDTHGALNSGEYDLQKAQTRATKLLTRKKCTRLKMLFRASQTMDIVSCVIADTGLGLNFWIGSNRYYLFLPCFMTRGSELEKIIASIQTTGNVVDKQKLLTIYTGGTL